MKKKKLPSLEHEARVGYPSALIAGADEVGRGCLAGPVVAAALVLPPEICLDQHPWLQEVNDSKQLNSNVRERLTPLLCSWAAAFAIGVASVREIDEINIFHASHLAIRRAVEGLSVRPDHILVDGKFLPRDKMVAPASAVIQGDRLCLSIAAASIIAKVWRDRHMVELDREFPGYGLAQHKGYPTLQHSRALKKSGITEIHRRSFKSIGALA